MRRCSSALFLAVLGVLLVPLLAGRHVPVPATHNQMLWRMV
jgi:hypothetical protein